MMPGDDAVGWWMLVGWDGNGGYRDGGGGKDSRETGSRMVGLIASGDGCR